MHMRCMRLGGLSGLVVGILVLLPPLAVQGEEPAYALTPWEYGMIAWVGGTPNDVQSVSAEITKAMADVFAFWELPMPEPIPADAIARAANYWMSSDFLTPVPDEPEEGWFFEGNRDAPSWMVVPAMQWQGLKLRPLLVVVFPNRELLMQASYNPRPASRTLSWLAVLTRNSCSIVASRGRGRAETWQDELHREFASAAFPLASPSFVAALREPSTSEESPAARSMDELSEREMEELTEAVRELATVLTTLSSLQEGFGAYTAASLACNDPWLRSAALFTDVDLPASLRDNSDLLPPNVAASVIGVIVDRVGRARTADEIFRIARSYKEELPILARDWRDALSDLQLTDGERSLGEAIRQHLESVEEMLAPILSEGALTILDRIYRGKGARGDIEAFWSEVLLPAPPPTEETWHSLQDRESLFKPYAEDEASKQLADRVELKLLVARTTENWYEYRSWFIYAVRALVAGLVTASPESSSP
jgi:hypothetical protein